MKLGGFFRIVHLNSLFHEICSLWIVVVTFARHFSPLLEMKLAKENAIS